MKSELFTLANQGDTYAQSFFTMIRFNCKNASIDMFIDLTYLYSISEYIRTFLFKHNERSIDIEDYDSIIVRSCMGGLHKQVVKTYYKIKAISLLNYLMIDPIIVFSPKELWNILSSGKYNDMNIIYNIPPEVLFFDYLNIESLNIYYFHDDQSKLFRLYLKATTKNMVCHFFRYV